MGLLKRYAFAACVIAYMAAILLLHALGLFPRAGIYDLSRLVGSAVVTLEGRVVDAPTLRWNQTRFLFEGRPAPWGFCREVRHHAEFPEPDLAPGDRIRVRGWLSVPAGVPDARF